MSENASCLLLKTGSSLGFWRRRKRKAQGVQQRHGAPPQSIRSVQLAVSPGLPNNLALAALGQSRRCTNRCALTESCPRAERDHVPTICGLRVPAANTLCTGQLKSHSPRMTTPPRSKPSSSRCAAHSSSVIICHNRLPMLNGPVMRSEARRV